METIEERNLNRLRNGKMMLDFGKQKKSFGLALLLTIIAGWLGAHRFYLGHKRFGFAFLALFSVAVIGGILSNSSLEHPLGLISSLLSVLLTTLIFIEILLSYWFVSRENARIKKRLSIEYGVRDLKVPL